MSLICLAPVELTLSVGLAAVLAYVNFTLSDAPATSENPATVDEGTLAAVADAVLHAA